MKISALAIATFISSACAEFNLRAAVNQLLSGEVEGYDARIIVGGLNDVITNGEAKEVAKQAMAAYNDVFSASATGQKLNAIEATAATNIPSDSLWWTGECRFCPKGVASKEVKDEAAFINARIGFSSAEDSSLLAMFLDKQVASSNNPVDLHLKFEEDLCNRLRMSGMANFAKAKECSFSFLAKPGMTEQVPVENTYAASGKTAQAELILAGLKKDMTKKDVKFLNEVVVSAHNEAFAKYGLALGSFQALADVAVGGFQGWLQQCTPCCYDDEPLCPDDALQNTVTVIVGNAMPLRTASLMTAVEMKPVDSEISNNAFDTLVCNKLRNSGNPVFEDVHTCSFNFVYTEVGKTNAALVN